MVVVLCVVVGLAIVVINLVPLVFGESRFVLLSSAVSVFLSLLLAFCLA